MRWREVLRVFVTWAGPQGSWTREYERDKEDPRFALRQDYFPSIGLIAPFVGPLAFIDHTQLIEFSRSPHEPSDQTGISKYEHATWMHKGMRTQTRMHVCLYEEERCMGTIERSLITRGRTYKERDENTNTNARTSLWGGEVHGHAWNTPSSKDDPTYKEGTKHTHKCSYAFMRRRGAWARPKHSLFTRGPNVQGRHKTHIQMLVHLYEEERCMGTIEMLPRHMKVERTRGQE